MILLDSSGLFAALDRGAAQHDGCRSAIEAADGPLLLSPFVLAEVDYLVTQRLGVNVADQVLADVARGAYQLEPMSAADVGRARAVTRRHADLGVGLADASLVVLAERHGVAALVSLDQRHFRVLTWGADRPFRLLPADA